MAEAVCRRLREWCGAKRGNRQKIVNLLARYHVGAASVDRWKAGANPRPIYQKLIEKSLTELEEQDANKQMC